MSQSPQPKSSRAWNLTKAILKYALFALIFWYVGTRFTDNLKRLEWSELTVSPLFMTSGILMMMFYFFCMMECWRLLVVNLGHSLHRRSAIRIWYDANMIKYLPGKVWFFVGRFDLSRRAGVPKLVVTYSIFLEAAMLNLAAILLYCACQGWLSESRFATGIYVALAIGGIIGLHPVFMNTAYRLYCRLSKREPRRLPVTYGRLLLMLLAYVFTWMVYSTACWLIALSLAVPASFPAFLAVFPFAWAIGYLSFFTPGGLGVREGATVLLLGDLMGQSAASLITVVVRLIWMAAEVAWFLIARFKGKINESTV